MERAPAATADPTTAEGTRSRDVASDVIRDAQRLVNLEIALARREVMDRVRANAIAAGVAAFGGLLLALAVLVAVPSLIVALVPWHWEAAAAWCGLYVVAGLILVFAGKSRIRFRLPERTIESLKENGEWALRRIRSNGR